MIRIWILHEFKITKSRSGKIRTEPLQIIIVDFEKKSEDFLINEPGVVFFGS